jgi:hypothetical protein
LFNKTPLQKGLSPKNNVHAGQADGELPFVP